MHQYTVQLGFLFPSPAVDSINSVIYCGESLFFTTFFILCIPPMSLHRCSLSLPHFVSLLCLSPLFRGYFTGSYHVFSLRQALRDLLQSARSRKPTRADYEEGIILYLAIMTLVCLPCHPSLFLCSPLPSYCC